MATTELGKQLEAMLKEDAARNPATGGRELVPLDFTQRLILQNLFDTQPERRKEYLNKLGWEMNPKDDNQVKPLGSGDDVEWDEIDPAPNLSTVLSPGKWAEGLKEFAKDVSDVGFDVAVAGPLSAAGAVGGAVAGGVAGGGVATAPLAVIGGILGGGAGNAAAEGIKFIGQEIFSDPEIPVDMQMLAFQSAVTGIMGKLGPTAFKAGGEGLKKLGIGRLKNQVREIKKAMVVTGGFDQDIVDDVLKNPGKYSKENLEGAFDVLKKDVNSLLGFVPDEQSGQIAYKSTRQIPKESLLGKIADPLNKKADTAIEKLSKMPEANFKLFSADPNTPGIMDSMKSYVDSLIAKGPDSWSDAEKSAFKYINQKMLDIAKTRAPEAVDVVGKRPTVNFLALADKGKEIDFKTGRNILKSIQEDAFDKNNPGAQELAKVVGGGEEGLRRLMDDKALTVMQKLSPEEAKLVDLPGINKQRSQLLGVYNNFVKTLQPDQIPQAFLGKDTMRKDAIVEGLTALDSIAKKANVDLPADKQVRTNFTEAIRSGAFQKQFNDVLTNPKAYGSGGPWALAMQEAQIGAAKGAGAGFAIGMASRIPGAASTLSLAGGIGGGLKGFSKGMRMGNIPIALESLKKASTKLRGKVSEDEFINFVENEMQMSLAPRVKEALSDVWSGAIRDIEKSTVVKNALNEFVKTLPAAQVGVQAATSPLSPGDPTSRVMEKTEDKLSALQQGAPSALPAQDEAMAAPAQMPTAAPSLQNFKPETELGRRLREMLSQEQPAQ